MGFLSPLFLGGLLLAGLPVYLHLLRQHTKIPLPFASLMFFEKRTQSSIKHRRLRYLLLLAARLALIALLALAFANPFISRTTRISAESKTLLLVLDDSFSMRAGSRLDDARREALRVIGAMRPGDKGQVLTANTQVQFLTQPAQDAVELRAAVQALKPGDAKSSFGELARAIRGVAVSTREPIEVHLFSDMQKTSLPPGFADLQLPTGATLVLHPAAAKPEPNWTVESVVAPGTISDPKKARLQATVAGYHTPAAKRTVSLAVNQRVVATKTVDVAPGGRAAVEFLSLDVPYGFSRCEIRIDSADSLKDDDRLLFAAERADPRRILLVHESRETRAALYLRSALMASAESAFALETVTAELAAGMQPSRFAFVVLSDVLSLPAAFEDELKKYVRGGGAVLVAAGPATGRRPRIPIFDEAVIESKYFARGGERFQTAGWVDPAHPSIRKAGRWEGVKFYQVVRVEPGQARVAVRMADQTPLLAEKTIGEGKAMLFASTFDNLSNDFPLQPAFVPFIEQTARYLGGLVDRSAVVNVGGFLELRSNKERGVAVEVIDPAGKRPFNLKDAATATTYQVIQEGFYELRRGNGRHEVVAVNADRRESDLTPADPALLALWTKTGEVAVESNGQSGEVRKPQSLWWYVMLIVLAAAVLESLLASQYLKAEQEAS